VATTKNEIDDYFKERGNYGLIQVSCCGKCKYCINNELKTMTTNRVFATYRYVSFCKYWSDKKPPPSGYFVIDRSGLCDKFKKI